MATTHADAGLLSVADVVRRFPGRTGRLHPSTVGRWIKLGYPLPDGTRVRLKAARLGSRWLIAAADLDAFVARLTAAHVPADDSSSSPVRSPAARMKAAAAAGDELSAMGV